MKFSHLSNLFKSYRSKIIIRVDDVCPTMNWNNFLYFKTALEELEINAVLGIVPNCQDQSLKIDSARSDFFSLVREWKNFGDTIAQHGYDHRYISTNSGLMRINKFSEFAGLNRDKQFKKLLAGKEILEKEGVWEPHFMAPAHSFDDITVECLRELRFETITDGYGVYPYRYKGLTFVPQLFSKPAPIPFGVQTVAIHLNHMNRQEIDCMLESFRKNKDRIVSYNSILVDLPTEKWRQLAIRVFTQAIVRTYRICR